MINKIKKYLFYRKYRWYRQDLMTTQFIKHRIKLRQIVKVATYQDEMITTLENLVKNQQTIIERYQQKSKMPSVALENSKWNLTKENNIRSL